MNGVTSPLAARVSGVFPACVGLLWIIPFIQPLNWKPVTYFLPEWFAIVLGLAACAILTRRAVPPGKGATTVLVALVLWGCLFALQPLWLPVPYVQTSIGHALLMLWAAGVVAAVQALRISLGAVPLIDRVAWYAAIGAVLAAAAGLIQWFAPPAFLDWLIPRSQNTSNLAGLIGHQSWFADHLLLGTLAIVWLVSRGRVSVAVAVPAMFVLAVPMSISGSRATLLMLLVLLLFGWSAVRARRSDPDMQRAGVWLAMASSIYVVCVVLGPSWWNVGGGVTARMAESVSAGGFSNRIELWSRALDVIAVSPVLGHGPDGLPWAVFRDSPHPSFDEFVIQAHNLFLQTTVTGGLPALGLLIMALAGMFIGARRGWRAGESWLPIGMLLVLLMRSMLDVPTSFAYFGGLLAATAGLLPLPRFDLPARVRVPRVAIATMLTLGAVAAGHTFWAYREFSMLWRVGESAERRQERYRHAVSNPFLMPIVVARTLEGVTLDTASARRSVNASARTVRWRPYPKAVLRHAIMLGLVDRPADACRLLARATSIYPNSMRRLVTNFDRRGADPVVSTTLDLARDLGDGTAKAASCVTVDTRTSEKAAQRGM